jgi:hypothetical protein
MKTTLLAIAMATLTLMGSCPLLRAGGNGDCPCYSIQEAKTRGCYVAAVSFSPSSFTWKGKEIVIKEAWLEKQTERNYSLNPFAPKYRIVPGYNLCFTLSKGWDVVWGTAKNSQGEPMRKAYFVLEGNGRSFAERWSIVLWETLEKADSSELTILCTDNWQLEDAVTIKAVPSR